MLNLFKKRIFGNNSPASSSNPVFECMLCHNSFNMNKKASEDYAICEDCFLQLANYIDSFKQNIANLQERANKAGKDGNSREQLSFLRSMLKCLNEYKETYYDKGIDVIEQDINQLIQQVQQVCDEAEIECADKKQYNIILKTNDIPLTEEEWLRLRAVQDEALSDVISLCNTIDESGYGFPDGRSLETEFLQTLLNLLIHLAMIDGEIDETERQIITDYLHIDDIDRYIENVKGNIRENDLLSLEIPPCMNIFTNVDQELISSGKNGTTTNTAINMLKQLGINFLQRSCIDSRKTEGLYQYLRNINYYMEKNDLESISLDEFSEEDTEAVDTTNDVKS